MDNIPYTPTIKRQGTNYIITLPINCIQLMEQNTEVTLKARTIPMGYPERNLQTGLDHIIDWIHKNKEYFFEPELNPEHKIINSRVLGEITPFYYNILPKQLRYELSRAGMNPNMFLKRAYEAGVLHTDPNKYQRTVRVGGEPTKVYSFKRSFVDDVERPIF